MRIAIIADTHDNLDNWERTKKQLQQLQPDCIIHAGDFTAPFMIDYFEQLNIEMHVVFGNIDDRFRTTRKCEASDYVSLHGELGAIEQDGRLIAFTHYPWFARHLAEAGNYDLVVYGHTHQCDYQALDNGTVLLNPGEIMGRKEQPGFALYDTETNTITFYEL